MQDRERESTTEQSTVSDLWVEIAGAIFLTKRVWKDGGLSERRYNYELRYDCDSGVYE